MIPKKKKRNETEAEILIDLAEEVLHPKDELLIIDGDPPLPECFTETVVLALRLRARPDLCLRAIMERWTGFQIVRELY